MNEDIIIAQALKNVLLSDIEAYDRLPQYKVPHRLDRRISKLIADIGQPIKKEKRKPIPLKRRLLIAAIIVIVMAIITGGITVITHNLGMFTVKQYDIYSMLSINDTEDKPNVLTEKYHLVIDSSQITKEIVDDNDHMYLVYYFNKTNEKQVYFSQLTKSTYHSVRLNTENAITYPELIEIGNNKNAVYFETYKHEKVLIWEMGDSIIQLNASGFSKDELIELSKFVKKVE